MLAGDLAAYQGTAAYLHQLQHTTANVALILLYPGTFMTAHIQNAGTGVYLRLCVTKTLQCALQTC